MDKVTVTLSEGVPSSTDYPPSSMARTGGAQATIWEEDDGTFSFCLHGIDSRTGRAWKGDDHGGFDTGVAAREAAFEEYIEETEADAEMEAILADDDRRDRRGRSRID